MLNLICNHEHCSSFFCNGSYSLKSNLIISKIAASHLQLCSHQVDLEQTLHGVKILSGRREMLILVFLRTSFCHAKKKNKVKIDFFQNCSRYGLQTSQLS